MNSISNLKKCLLELEQYIFIHCYLDNDLAGQKTVETIAGLYGIKVIDHSKNYYNYKDLNDYLRGKRALVFVFPLIAYHQPIEGSP